MYCIFLSKYLFMYKFFILCLSRSMLRFTSDICITQRYLSLVICFFCAFLCDIFVCMMNVVIIIQVRLYDMIYDIIQKKNNIQYIKRFDNYDWEQKHVRMFHISKISLDNQCTKNWTMRSHNWMWLKAGIFWVMHLD